MFNVENEIMNQILELNICLRFSSLFYSSMFLNINKLEKLYINRKIKLIMYTVLVTKNFYYFFSDIKTSSLIYRSSPPEVFL